MGRERAGVPDKRMALRALCVCVCGVCVCACVRVCVCVHVQTQPMQVGTKYVKLLL